MKVLVADQAWAMVQLPPGDMVQNSKRALGQPDALAVTVTAVPASCGEPGEAEAVIPGHGVVVSV